MKSISTTNPAITENTECTIIKARTPVIDIKVGVLPLTQCVITLYFQLFKRLANIPMQKLPLLALHLPKSHTKALYNAHTANCHLHGEGEMNWSTKDNKGELWYSHDISIGADAVGKRYVSG